MRISLGDRVRDMVSGFEGIATGRFEYLNGCVRWEIAASDEKGMPVAHVFDEPQIGVIVAGAFCPATPVAAAGGPRGTDAPPR